MQSLCGSCAWLRAVQVFDAYVMVTTQLSQRLGLPLNAISPTLLPVLPPFLEQAVAAHNNMLLQGAHQPLVTQQPAQPKPQPAPAVQLPAMPQRPSNSPFGAPSVQAQVRNLTQIARTLTKNSLQKTRLHMFLALTAY